MRLDELLVAKNLCTSRTLAKSLINAGLVRDSRTGAVLDKPGKVYPSDIEPIVDAEAMPRYVSRGGDKLAAFVEQFAIDLSGKHLLDIGASTGGFTDCALQRGAESATCVDVGQGQLHPRLLTDPRVTNLEKINARHLNPDDLPRLEYDIVVCDLSFISLHLVLPAIWVPVVSGGLLIALVKPQFEAGKAAVDRGGGVIKDRAVQEKALKDVIDFALRELPGATLLGSIDSPITGTDGNREFLLGLRRTSSLPI